MGVFDVMVLFDGYTDMYRHVVMGVFDGYTDMHTSSWVCLMVTQTCALDEYTDMCMSWFCVVVTQTCAFDG